jgi:thiamine biosynthesis lipoprotein
MRLRSSIEVRRCRPLLGTFVDVACEGSLNDIDRAFATIEKVHRLMSFHDRQSDVSRMNRDAFHKSVRIHPWTWRVLKCAQEFSRKTDGVLDITIARRLVQWDYLPRPDRWLCDGGSWRDIVLDDEGTVRFRSRVIVDLGGIAKGFAVDRAVETLQDNGVTAGIVNAGGDLRTFGLVSRAIHLRHPAESTHVARAARLRERAMATSGIYFQRREYRGKSIGPLLDGRTGQSSCELISVSVAAAECMVADVLTKIVFALREKAAALLTECQADALLLERDAAPSWMFYSSCDTHDGDSIRLKRLQRYFLYMVLALFFLSGAAWAYWNYLIASPGDFETSAKAWAMKIHGAGALAVLVLIGMLLSAHVRFSCRARRNRANGSVFLSALAVLTTTGYGLYYAGGERLRAWTSWIHLSVGLVLPILLLIHIFLGRRTRHSAQLRSGSRFSDRDSRDRHPKSHYYQSQGRAQ